MRKIIRVCLFGVLLLICGCGRGDGLYTLIDSETGVVRNESPLVVLTGKSNSRVDIAYLLEDSFKRSYDYAAMSVSISLIDRSIRLEPVTGKPWCYTLSEPVDIAGEGDLVLSDSSGVLLSLSGCVKVIDKFRITLTFDDGPGVDKKSAPGNISTSPTVKLLDGLDSFRHGVDGGKTGIKAAFFVLTTSDRFMKIVYNKAETEDGKAVLREVARRGHIIGVHSGGEYGSQFNTHVKRAGMPPYSVCGKGEEIFDNALDADIYECVETITRVTGCRPEFVRPPLWRYRDKNNNNIERVIKRVYDKYGLEMILSDARFPDGGYHLISIVSVNKYRQYRKNLRRAFLSGEDNIVISMHDSNRYTANIITGLLEVIVDEFEDTAFSGVKGDAGVRLDFADSTGEVRVNLSGKSRYVMFPEYNRDK